MADQTRVGERDRSGADPAGGAAGRAGDAGRVSPNSTEVPANDRRRDTRHEATGAVPTVAPDDAEWTQPGEATKSEQPTRPRVGSATTRSEQNRSSSTMSESLRRLTRPRGQIRARKVHRIVRRIDPWSILKVSLVFYFCVWIMVLVALVLMWGVAVGSGTVASLESFIAEFLAFEEFRFNGDQLFQLFALGGLIGVFVTTAVTAVLAVLFNLIADLTGGVRMTVIEEESARRVVPRGRQGTAAPPR
jgi:hypothetical protein